MFSLRNRFKKYEKCVFWYLFSVIFSIISGLFFFSCSFVLLSTFRGLNKLFLFEKLWFWGKEFMFCSFLLSSFQHTILFFGIHCFWGKSQLFFFSEAYKYVATFHSVSSQFLIFLQLLFSLSCRFMDFMMLTSSFFLISSAASTMFLDPIKWIVVSLNVLVYFLLSKQNTWCQVLYKENKLIFLAVLETKGPVTGGLIHLDPAESFSAGDIIMEKACKKISNDEKEGCDSQGLGCFFL